MSEKTTYKIKIRDLEGHITPYDIGALDENIKITSINPLLANEDFNYLSKFLKTKLDYITILNSNSIVNSFNDLKESGIYKILKSIPNNCPVENSANSSLIVLKDNKTIYHIFFNESNSFVIRKGTIEGNNITWSEWDNTLSNNYVGVVNEESVSKRGLVPAATVQQIGQYFLRSNGQWEIPDLDFKYPNINKINEFLDTTPASIEYTEKIIEETEENTITEVEKTKSASTFYNGGLYIKNTNDVEINPVTYGEQKYNNVTASAIFDGGIYVEKKIKVGPEGGIYGAVWNDLADSIPVDDEAELEPGYCYCIKNNKYLKSSKYMDTGIIGIHSDTYGFQMGGKPDCKQLDCAVSGFVLAYVDKDYLPGTALTCTKDGRLTKMKFKDKQKYPERIVATYWKDEPNEEWGSDTRRVKVNGRKWVKIK